MKTEEKHHWDKQKEQERLDILRVSGGIDLELDKFKNKKK